MYFMCEKRQKTKTMLYLRLWQPYMLSGVERNKRREGSETATDVGCSWSALSFLFPLKDREAAVSELGLNLWFKMSLMKSGDCFLHLVN